MSQDIDIITLILQIADEDIEECEDDTDDPEGMAIARTHREQFEAIKPVLEAAPNVLKIAKVILDLWDRNELSPHFASDCGDEFIELKAAIDEAERSTP